MTYPWTFRLFTPWTRVLRQDKHKIDPLDTEIYPWTLQIHSMDTAVFRVFPMPLDIPPPPPMNGFFLEEPIIKLLKISSRYRRAIRPFHVHYRYLFKKLQSVTIGNFGYFTIFRKLKFERECQFPAFNLILSNNSIWEGFIGFNILNPIGPFLSFWILRSLGP